MNDDGMDESNPVDRPDNRPISSSDEAPEEPSVHANGDASHSDLTQNDSMLEEAPDPTDEPNEQDEEGIPSPEESTERITRLPLSRIKHMIRTDPDIQLASQDAVFLVAKATEMFIGVLMKETYNVTKRSKKKTVQKQHMEESIKTSECLEFLDGALEGLL
ncbi:unnamed protein product [Darwinula stevensoni]|uniref:Transcription factor CBF/NF-Y/archaeal histone domain-containing protein n=1 Tax=Darwinula stevensoni TaxID=69355 RepID=A0A7R8X3Z5_9CRUS|nr:unnamed protein product [Darwinula stevensoni]CAG0882916.1 unnamed protein product [Darwinula stevensoni]